MLGHFVACELSAIAACMTRLKKSSKPHLGIPICDKEFCTSCIFSKNAVARYILSGLEEVGTIYPQEGFVS